MGTHRIGCRVGASSFLAVAVALVAPGVATVHAQSGSSERIVARESTSAPVTPKSVAPSASATVSDTSPVDAGPAPKRRLRRVRHEELSNELMQASADIIKTHHAEPVGSEVLLEVAGKRYIARIEQHFHPEGGSLKPWGYHPGVSLFVAIN